MKQLVAAAALCLASVAAHADPAQPEDYAALGASLGVDNAGIYLGPKLDLGHQLAPSLFVHGSVLVAANAEIDGPDHGTRAELALGLEVRPCVANGVLCGIVGIDLLRRDTSGNTGDDGDVDEHDIALRERAGFELGVRAWRLRGSIDVDSAAGSPFDGLALDAAIVHSW
jgi:hypothetical protein